MDWFHILFTVLMFSTFACGFICSNYCKFKFVDLRCFVQFSVWTDTFSHINTSIFFFFFYLFFLDPEYTKFLEYYNGDEEKFTSSPEILLEELEAKSKELVGRKYCIFCLNSAQKNIVEYIFHKIFMINCQV